MNREFWNGKRVFVTGHTGFKGSWLSVWLQMLGADVVGYALAPHTEPSMFKAANIGEGMASIEADVRDAERLNDVMASYQPEIIIHMAAQALVRKSYTDPVATYTTNIIGTMNVLEAVRRTPSVRVVVLITSDKCYENLEWVWGYRENDRMGGHDPYSSSKGCTELLIAAYRDSYFNTKNYADHGVAVASTRAGNVIGGGDWSEDRLVPDTIRAIQRGEPVLIRRPGAIRPWQFVLEPLRGYLELAEKLWESGTEYTGAWNFGPNIEEIKPVSWLVERLATLWGGGASWEIDSGQHPHEDHFLKLDCTKSKSLLPWYPRLSIETLMDWIVEWYQSAESKADIRNLTEEQITRYENLREESL
jgi:CDP-glucose 4,6-dehydratase